MVSSEQFANAYTHHFKTTVGFLQSRGVLRGEAIELAQSAWVRGWERRAQLKEAAAVHPWINSIAWNMHRSALRRAGVIELTSKNAGSVYNRAERKILFSEVLRRCSAADRRLVYEWCFLDLPAAAIGARYQTTELAIRVRLCRFKQRIRQRLHL